MLGLKFETATSWAEIAEDNLEQILTDHAFAEQKASANAISIIINYSEETALVKDMTSIALEELEHFLIRTFASILDNQLDVETVIKSKIELVNKQLKKNKI